MNALIAKASLTLALATVVTACQPSPQPATDPQAQDATANSGDMPQTAMGKAAQKAIAKAGEKLAHSNISLNNEFQFGQSKGRTIAKVGNKPADDPRPDAQLTPEGGLLLDGRKVETTAAQHALLVKYRQQVMDVAESGMALGVQGADLGGKAIQTVFSSLLSGNPDEIDAKVESEAGKLEAGVRRLCAQLPALRETQQELAAQLPEFRPYATLEQSDIEDCSTEAKDTIAASAG